MNKDDLIQKNIDERLEKARHHATNNIKKKSANKMQIVFSALMAIGVLAGLIAILVQVFLLR